MNNIITKVEELRDKFNSHYSLEENAYQRACDDVIKHLQNLQQSDFMCFLPISKVVFFELKNGKYLASNGVEVTTEFILKHEHAIFNNNGYVIVEKQ